LMFVFEGSIASWGRRGYAIYIPKHLEKFAAELHGKPIMVVVIPKEMSDLTKPLEELRKEIETLRKEIEELRRRVEGG